MQFFIELIGSILFLVQAGVPLVDVDFDSFLQVVVQNDFSESVRQPHRPPSGSEYALRSFQDARKRKDFYIKNVTSMFWNLDSDKNDKVNVVEFSNCFNIKTPEDASVLARLVDTNGDDEVGLDEFTTWLISKPSEMQETRKPLLSNALLHRYIGNVANVFFELDGDGDKELSNEELSELFHARFWDETSLKELVDIIDANKNSRVDFIEFRAWFAGPEEVRAVVPERQENDQSGQAKALRTEQPNNENTSAINEEAPADAVEEADTQVEDIQNDPESISTFNSGKVGESWDDEVHEWDSERTHAAQDYTKKDMSWDEEVQSWHHQVREYKAADPYTVKTRNANGSESISTFGSGKTKPVLSPHDARMQADYDPITQTWDQEEEQWNRVIAAREEANRTCVDMPDTGFQNHDGLPMACSELVVYCKNVAYASELQTKCPRSCGQCGDSKILGNNSSKAVAPYRASEDEIESIEINGEAETEAKEDSQADSDAGNTADDLAESDADSAEEEDAETCHDKNETGFKSNGWMVPCTALVKECENPIFSEALQFACPETCGRCFQMKVEAAAKKSEKMRAEREEREAEEARARAVAEAEAIADNVAKAEAEAVDDMAAAREKEEEEKNHKDEETKKTCKDSDPDHTGFSTEEGGSVACSTLAEYCNVEGFNAQIRLACPATCGLCGPGGTFVT